MFFVDVKNCLLTLGLHMSFMSWSFVKIFWNIKCYYIFCYIFIYKNGNQYAISPNILKSKNKRQNCIRIFIGCLVYVVFNILFNCETEMAKCTWTFDLQCYEQKQRGTCMMNSRLKCDEVSQPVGSSLIIYHYWLSTGKPSPFLCSHCLPTTQAGPTNLLN